MRNINDIADQILSIWNRSDSSPIDLHDVHVAAFKATGDCQLGDMID